ncbi:MAG TPA: 5-deoxy-glucuronate isomerase [Humibacter sp.]|nr:5-deoxy-glucuronate isomerase [Humibacter sp.]
MVAQNEWFFPRGALARDGWQAVVDDSVPKWHHTGLRVAELTGNEVPVPGAGTEAIVVPLSGSFTVRHDGAVTELTGRRSVFDGATDVLFLGASTTGTVSGHGRVALATSPTKEDRPSRYLAASDTPIELRGAGQASRQVHNFGVPGVLDAARLIVCEVVTPAGNWSSYPPHKHDESVPGRESRLEEIYYFEAATERGRAEAGEPFGLFSAYSSGAGEIEVDGLVHSGDIALLPYGYHGPAVAAPGYDLYYLNVMAGPDAERQWLITDDPAHAWLRGTWREQAVDGRLPYSSEKEGRR